MHRSLSNCWRGWSVARRRVRWVATGLALLAGGCQTYERSELNINGHLASFLARSPENPEVRAFAESLAARDSDHNAFDPTDGVSCAEAEVIALVFNPDLRLARLRAGVARATADNAGLWEDPTLGVDLTRVIQSTPEPWKVFTSLGITIPVSGRLEVEKQRAGAEHAAELSRVAMSEWSTRMSVRRSWSQWSALVARLAAERAFVTRVDQVLGVVDKMEQAGELTRTEARLFRIERATRAADLATLESRTHEAELRLRQLIGMSPDASLRFDAAGFAPVRSGAGGIVDPAELELRSPAMLVAAAEYEAAEKALELEIRKQYPDIHIGPGYGREDGQDQVLLGISLPIPILNANKQRIAEARARRELARLRAETTLEQTVAAIRAAEIRLEAASRLCRTVEAEIIPLVEAQYSDAQQLARLGEVDALVLLESLTRQHDAKVGFIEAARDEALAGVDLEELVGPVPTSARERAPEDRAQGSSAESSSSESSLTAPEASGSLDR